jgi:hypothetical protein
LDWLFQVKMWWRLLITISSLMMTSSPLGTMFPAGAGLVGGTSSVVHKEAKKKSKHSSYIWAGITTHCCHGKSAHFTYLVLLFLLEKESRHWYATRWLATRQKSRMGHTASYLLSGQFPASMLKSRMARWGSLPLTSHWPLIICCFTRL